MEEAERNLCRALSEAASVLLEKAHLLLDEAHKLGEVHETLIGQATAFVQEANHLIAKAKELED